MTLIYRQHLPRSLMPPLPNPSAPHDCQSFKPLPRRSEMKAAAAVSPLFAGIATRRSPCWSRATLPPPSCLPCSSSPFPLYALLFSMPPTRPAPLFISPATRATQPARTGAACPLLALALLSCSLSLALCLPTPLPLPHSLSRHAYSH
jgi:hypothetical protein